MIRSIAVGQGAPHESEGTHKSEFRALSAIVWPVWRVSSALVLITFAWFASNLEWDESLSSALGSPMGWWAREWTSRVDLSTVHWLLFVVGITLVHTYCPAFGSWTDAFAFVLTLILALGFVGDAWNICPVDASVLLIMSLVALVLGAACVRVGLSCWTRHRARSAQLGRLGRWLSRAVRVAGICTIFAARGTSFRVLLRACSLYLGFVAALLGVFREVNAIRRRHRANYRVCQDRLRLCSASVTITAPMIVSRRSTRPVAPSSEPSSTNNNACNVCDWKSDRQPLDSSTERADYWDSGMSLYSNTLVIWTRLLVFCMACEDFWLQW